MQRKSFAAFAVCLILVGVVLTTQLSGGGVELENPWPMVGGNLQNTGRSRVDTSHVEGEELWNRSISAGLLPGDTSPVIDFEDNLYFTSSHVLLSIYPSGEDRWNFSTPGYELTAPGLGPDGTVYVGSRDENRLYALDRRNGDVLWHFDTIGYVTTPPVVGPNNRIYFSSHDRDNDLTRVYAINRNGILRWVFEEINDKLNSRVTIGSNGWIYFSSWDNHVYALNSNGQLEWKLDPAPSWGISNQIHSSPAYHDGRLYIGILNGLSAIDASTGDIIWHFPDERHEEFDFGDNVVVWASPAVGRDGTIFFGCTLSIGDDDPFIIGRIYALYPDGMVRWHMDTYEQLIAATPAIGREGTVYMGTYDHRVYAFEPSGKVLWNASVDRGINSSPAISSNGTVYFVSDSPFPRVFAFSNERPQEQQWYRLHWKVILIIVGLTAAISTVAILHRRRK